MSLDQDDDRFSFGADVDGVGCWLALLGVPFVLGFMAGALCAHYGWMGF